MQDRGPCPFYLSRDMATEADIIFMPYQYVLDGRTRVSLTSVNWEKSVVIFDEAHNVEVRTAGWCPCFTLAELCMWLRAQEGLVCMADLMGVCCRIPVASQPPSIYLQTYWQIASERWKRLSSWPPLSERPARGAAMMVWGFECALLSLLMGEVVGQIEAL